MHGAARRELVVGSQLSEMTRVESWLAEVVGDWRLPEQAAFAIDLVVNEAVTNIMNYAYSDQVAHSIRITLTHSGAWVEVEILDDGRPFNPLSVPATRSTEALRDAAVGGWGIPLIKAFSTEQDYAYVAGTNRLRLRIASARHA